MNKKINSLHSKEARMQFLKSCNSDELNSYFKNMENLSKKNNTFKNIYYQDIDYVLSLDNHLHPILQQGGILTNAFRKKNDPFLNIADLTPDSYCVLSTQKSNTDNRCHTRILELDIIKDIVEAVNEGKLILNEQNKKRVEHYIKKFVEIIICCSQTYIDNDVVRKSRIIPITKLIVNSPVLTNIATKYISWILTNEKGKYVKEYRKIEEKIRLLKSRNQQNTPEYAQVKKQKLDMINKYGVSMIYITKLINWIYNENIRDTLIQ